MHIPPCRFACRLISCISHSKYHNCAAYHRPCVVYNLSVYPASSFLASRRGDRIWEFAYYQVVHDAHHRPRRPHILLCVPLCVTMHRVRSPPCCRRRTFVSTGRQHLWDSPQWIYVPRLHLYARRAPCNNRHSNLFSRRRPSTHLRPHALRQRYPPRIPTASQVHPNCRRHARKPPRPKRIRLTGNNIIPFPHGTIRPLLLNRIHLPHFLRPHCPCHVSLHETSLQDLHRQNPSICRSLTNAPCRTPSLHNPHCYPNAALPVPLLSRLPVEYRVSTCANGCIRLVFKVTDGASGGGYDGGVLRVG